MIRPRGMHPRAFRAYIRACYDAQVSPDNRVMQTIGDAPASKGVHASDGTLDGVEYCAAVDLRTKDLTKQQIKTLLKCLAINGFCAWYRFEGSFTNNRHIHAIFAALPMKPALKKQVAAFLVDRNGLANNERETFYTAPPATDAAIYAMFLDWNDQGSAPLNSKTKKVA